MPIETYKPPYYQPRLPIGGGGGNINIPAPEGSGIPEIAKIIAAGMERRQQRELEERKFALSTKLTEARIGALGRSGQPKLRTTADVIKDMRNNTLLEGEDAIKYPIEAQARIKEREELRDEYAALTDQVVKRTPATAGTLEIPKDTGAWWNLFDTTPKVAAIPPTPAAQRLVPQAVGPPIPPGYRPPPEAAGPPIPTGYQAPPQAVGPPVPKRVTPGLEGIIKGTFDKEEPKAEKPTKEKPAEAGEPKSEQEFMDKVADLKVTDMKAARAYYDKWVKKWQ